MNNSNSNLASTPSLFLIGLGVKIPEHTTIEAQEALSSCRMIYSIVQAPPHIWLSREIFEKVPVVDVMQLYKENAPRRENYESAAEAIMEELQRTQPIGYVTYGNPFVYDSVSSALIKRARDKKLHVKVIPGISSIDTLLCDLLRDMAPGIQICEATWMVAAGVKPQTDLPVVLLQLGAFGSLRAHYAASPPSSSLRELVLHLLQFYPPQHEVIAVRSADDPQHSSLVTSSTLKDLCAAESDLMSGSLYVPALQVPQVDSRVIEKLLRQ